MSRLRVYNVTLEPAAALAAVRSSGHRADVNASAPAVFSVDVVGGALVYNGSAGMVPAGRSLDPLRIVTVNGKPSFVAGPSSPNPFFRVSVCAAPILNAAGQPRVTLSPR